MIKNLKNFVRVGLGLALAALGSAAAAAYPEQPIRVINPYPAGAAGDIVLRVLQQSLAEELGQPVVAEYKTGAGGNIGGQAVVRAAPDGYTLLLGATNNFVINQFVYKDLGYDPAKDLTPIARLAEVPAFIYVNSSLPVKDYAGLAKYAKEHPGTLNYGTPGAGTTPALSGWMLNKALKGDMMAIQYRGAAPAVQALAANEVQVYIGGYGIGATLLPTGKIKAVAVAAPKRLSLLPDVPTTKELGIPDVVVSNWWGLAAPAGTSPEIVAKLSQAVQKALSNPANREQLEKLGFIVPDETNEQFKASLPKEAEYWRRIVEEAGVKL